MPKGYWGSVYPADSNKDAFEAYSRLAGPAVQQAGGRLLTRGDRVAAYERGAVERVILIEFDSYEDAVAARDSEAYQRALGVLGDSAIRDFRIVEGLD